MEFDRGYTKLGRGDSASSFLRRLSLAAGFALGSIMTPAGLAHAADLTAPIPAPPPVSGAQDWTGFYLGGHMGLADAFAHYDYATGLTNTLTNGTRIGRINGAAPGVFGGFNYQMGPFVVGLEGDATFTNGMFSLVSPSFDFLQFSNAIYTVSGRGGYLVTPATLVYAKLGYSGIQLSGFDAFGNVFHHAVNGTQTGLGIEHLLTNNIVLRLEGTYTTADRDLVLNQGYDHYRTSFLTVTTGLAFKWDPVPQHDHPAPNVDLTNHFITHDPNWTSVYVGGQAGIAASQVTRYDATLKLPNNLMGPYSDLNFAGGVVGGADLQLGRYFVVGAAIDTNWMHATFTDDVGVGPSNIFHQFAHIDRVSALTGRVGYLISPTTLLYGKGGPAQIRFVPEQAYFSAIDAAVVTSAHNLPAVQGGMGMETAIADHVDLRIEGLYTRATHSVIIDGVVPSQTALQPATFTATAGLVVKY